ncbi:aromatic-ring-hydroxylating dioxygenase subunit beta [Actinacidiphila oryziradicis]|uniref:aromatic-ring-hydroxylating dioxygenase subunit beta n=1 Tax=Actinacidiphila oryziradicis TaxID=2571141 RepID=UPI001B80A4EC|nr:aromatic-ring-hydroxylating dioxygenase subunit beta [Actinacidiphila oryziradicis]
MTVTTDVFGLLSRAQAEYARCIDEGPLEDWPAFFEEDCHYRITTADNHRQGLEAGVVWADNRRMLADRISALREANIYEAHTYRHILGQPAILEEFGDGARSETGFIVVRVMRDGTTGIFATGRYIDRYRFDNGRASLAERIVVCDSSAIDTLLALPL